MTAAEYTQHVVQLYQSLSDSIAQSDLPSVGKELALLKLKQKLWKLWPKATLFVHIITGWYITNGTATNRWTLK